MNIVVTGNIGCGKSTVVKALAELLPSYELHDVDKMVHALYDNAQFTTWLNEVFGTSDRRRISDVVFTDPGARKFLEKESEKYLGAEVERVYTIQNAILEYPLYFEMGEWKRPNQIIVCVSCNEATQIARVKARNSFTDEKIHAIMASQLPTWQKEAQSDFVIDNNDGADLQSQLRELEAIICAKQSSLDLSTQ